MKIEKFVLSVSLWTLISRILGYIRDVAIAFYLGASIFNDAFIIALRLPNMFRNIFAEGALNNVFIPIFSKKLKNDNKEAMNFAANIQIILIIALLICSAIIMYNMSYVIKFLARGYANNSQLIDLATQLGLISFPYIIFISLTAFYGGISNSLGSFIPFALAPIIMNLTLIGFICFGQTQLEKTYWLTISLPIAGIIEMLWLIYFVHRKTGGIKLKFPNINPDTKIFFSKFASSLVGSGIAQINLIISTTIGSFTVSGISYLYFADRIYQLPLALIGTAIATVILPELSKKFAKSQMQKFRFIEHKASIFIFYTTVPCVFILSIMSSDIIKLLFEHGAFNEEATYHTAVVLKIFALGLPMYCYMKVFTSSFYSMGDVKTPVKIAAFSLLINALISFLLLYKFQHVAVAIASVTTAYVSTFIMGYILYKRNLYTIFSKAVVIKLKILLSCVIMSLMVLLLREFLVLKSLALGVILNLFVAALIYLSLCYILKIRLLKSYFNKN